VFTPTNKLIDLLPYFKEKLTDLYGEREVENMFYWCCEAQYGLSKIEVRIGEQRLTESEILEMRQVVKRLEKSEPFHYIIGETEFFDCRIKVDNNVLIPRPETEELVAWVLESLNNHEQLLDIGTGSGCIPIAIKKNAPRLNVFALDVSPEALNMAKASSNLNQVDIHFVEKDILQEDLADLPKFDVIISNPPYVLESDKTQMNTNVLKFEPHLALFVADEDPLLFYKRIGILGLEQLNPKGFLFFEIHKSFGKETKIMLEELGYQYVQVKSDMQGKDRMIRCQL
jgi:release factor glutamine methyltransferase